MECRQRDINQSTPRTRTTLMSSAREVERSMPRQEVKGSQEGTGVFGSRLAVFHLSNCDALKITVSRH